MEQPELKIATDDALIHLLLAGNLTDEYLPQFQNWARQVHQTVLTIYKKTGQKVRFLTDVSRLKYMSREIIKEFIKLLKANKIYVHKSATFGGNLETMAALSFSSVASDRANFQHFKTEKEARDWLLSND